MISGSIPKKILYVFSDSKNINVGSCWDWMNSPNKIKVIPAMAVDANNKKTILTAEKWASDNGKKNVSKTESDNIIKDIILCNIEYRGNGGRAYKVIADGYYVDLREDVLTDIMLKSSIINGKINGEFIWAMVNSEMKIVRKDSELYNELIKSANLKSIKPIPIKELEVGGIYEDRNGMQSIFLGIVDTYSIINNTKIDSFYKPLPEVKENFSINRINKALLFFNISYEKFSLEKEDKLIINDIYYYSYNKSHSFIKKIEQTKIEDNIVELIRKKYKKIFSNLYFKEKQKIQSCHYYVEKFSKLINVYPVGANEPIFDHKKIQVFL